MLVLHFFVLFICICSAHIYLVNRDEKIDENQGGSPLAPYTIAYVDIDLPPSLAGIAVVGEPIEFQIRKDAFAVGIIEKVTLNNYDDFFWSGSLLDGEGSFNLKYFDGAIAANIEYHNYILRAPQRPKYFPKVQFVISALNVSNGAYRINEVQLEKYDTDADFCANMPQGEIPKNLPNNPPPPITDKNGILDLAVLYTPEAYVKYKDASNQDELVLAHIKMSVEMANLAFENSGIHMRVRVVMTKRLDAACDLEVSCVENCIGPDPNQNTNRCKSNILKDFSSGGRFADDYQLTEEAGVDMVVLFGIYGTNPEFCGHGYFQEDTNTRPYLPAQYSVIMVSLECPQFLAREIAHNMGSNVNLNNKDKPACINDNVYDFHNFGWCWDTVSDQDTDESANQCKRSIEATSHCETGSGRSDCARDIRFSNPTIQNGALAQPTGTEEANNAGFINEQVLIVTNRRPSRIAGGMVNYVYPPFVNGEEKCNVVTIYGWALGNGTDIVSVSLKGFEVQKIISQSATEVTVLAAQSRIRYSGIWSFGTGNVTVTTRDGSVSTLQNGFTYKEALRVLKDDFEEGSVDHWVTEGALRWEPKKYCNDLTCGGEIGPRPTNGGPAVGAGNGQAGNVPGYFYKIRGTDNPAETGSLVTHFNNGTICDEFIVGLKLYYHMYSPQPECVGALKLMYKANFRGQPRWYTFSVPPDKIQQNIDDEWEVLEADLTLDRKRIVHEIRIVAEPYSANDPQTGLSCSNYSAIGIDKVSVSVQTLCGSDLECYTGGEPPPSPTVSPTAGLVIVTDFPRYQIYDNTNSASDPLTSVDVLVGGEEYPLCGGDNLVFSTCEFCASLVSEDPQMDLPDTYLRLYASEDDAAVAGNDDGCGLDNYCSRLKYTVPGNSMDCKKTFTLRQGCYDDENCFGVVKFTAVGARTSAPTTAPTNSPLISPTAEPSPNPPPPEPLTDIWYTGFYELSETNSASSANTESYCVDVRTRSDLVVQTFNNTCGDSRGSSASDSYIRLRRDSRDGELIGENDDKSWPDCSDSYISIDVNTGRYCLMMGCYNQTSCSYEAKIIAIPTNTKDAVLYTDLQNLKDTNSASNKNSEVQCFDVFEPATVTAQTWANSCSDTSSGDPYIRLRKDGFDGKQITENDDYDWPSCIDSYVSAEVTGGRYCLIMGCYAELECSYRTKISIVHEANEPTPQPTQSPNISIYYTPVGSWRKTDSASKINWSGSYCIDIEKLSIMTAQTYNDTCYDTRVTESTFTEDDGDAYIRIRRNSRKGELIAENDDVEWPRCSDSRILMTVSAGRYCLMMGCYSGTSCSYSSKIMVQAVAESDLGRFVEGTDTETIEENNKSVPPLEEKTLTAVLVCASILAGLLASLYVYRQCSGRKGQGKDVLEELGAQAMMAGWEDKVDESGNGIVMGSVIIYAGSEELDPNQNPEPEPESGDVQ